MESISNMSTHLRGAFQVFQLRMKKVGMAPGRVITPMERIVAESLLYSTALVSLHVDLDAKMLEDLFKTTGYVLVSEPFSDASRLANSPFLAVGPGLYRVICKISQLCRRAPLRSEDQSSVDALADELRSVIASMDRALALEPDTATQRKILPSKLYAVAAHILLYKLQHPSVDASHAWIQGRVREAIGIIQSLPNPYSPSQYICWPLYIVGCAVVRADDVVFVRDTLHSLWQVSCCGDLTRAARALEANWAAKDGEPSGLDMLLYRRSTLYQ
jgi:Fungal specific transcription factor domain